MANRIWMIITVFCIFCLSTACAPRTASYVDPKFTSARIGDIKTPAKKHSAIITAEYMLNGNRNSDKDGAVKAVVEKYFISSGVISPANQNYDIAIKVVLNNITNPTSSFWKAFGTGMTFGVVGSTVTDGYEVTITASYKNGESVKKEYKHAIYTTVGAKSAPVENSYPMTAGAAVEKVIEDIVLNFIKDMQSQKKLTFHNYLHVLYLDAVS